MLDENRRGGLERDQKKISYSKKKKSHCSAVPCCLHQPINEIYDKVLDGIHLRELYPYPY